MSTYEDRIVVLERKVAALELRRLYDERKAEESTPSAQAFNLREINENMTILLGVIGSQGEDVRIVKDDVSTLKQDVSTLKQDVSSLKQGMSRLEQDVSSLKQDINQRFTSLEARLEQVLHILTTFPKTDK